MKQTAVDILYSFLYEMKSFNGFDPYNFNHKEVFNQAKEMEKEQIMNAFEAAEKDCGRDFLHGDLYYNETFKPYCMPEGLDTPEKHEQYLKDIGLNNK